LIIAAVAALVAGFVLLYTQVDWFRAAVDAAVSAILGALQWLWDWVSTNWPLLLAILTGPFGIAAKLIIDNWDTIKNAALGVFDWIRDNWPLLLAILTGPFGLAVLAITRNWDSIRDFFYRLPGQIQGWLSNIYNIITYPFRTAFDWITSAGKNVTDWFYNLPGNVNRFFSSLANIIKYPFTVAFDAIKSAWNNTVGGFGFDIPSWVPGFLGGGKSFKIPRMASGGIVNRPTIAMIGEAGPEAVVPLNRLASTSDIGGPTYIINVYALTATAEVGRRVVESISEFERVSGRRVSSG
jgi:phage-related protein